MNRLKISNHSSWELELGASRLPWYPASGLEKAGPRERRGLEGGSRRKEGRVRECEGGRKGRKEGRVKECEGREERKEGRKLEYTNTEVLLISLGVPLPQERITPLPTPNQTTG